MTLEKSWVLKGKGSEKKTHVLKMYLYRCESCRATLRVPIKEKKGEEE